MKPPPQALPPPPPPPPPAQSTDYFQDKRGEINDLKAMLRDIGTERDPRKKREVVRKVIALDTLGYDCSRLFGEMVIATYTTDIVVKKMAYQYLSHYARSNAELATLCINTMIKDCKDADPMVRGLAVRSLSSLQLASTIEYLLPALVAALQDPAPYVRRNAVLGVLKLFNLQPTVVTEETLTSKVRALIHDRDAQVVMASIQCLDEILREQGGLPCDQALSIYLLNRISDFNEWGTASVLQLVSRYNPTETKEVFDIMNVLDPCLRQTNSAVVLGATKIFIRFAERMPDIKTAVYLRLKQPILTLIASSADEIKYAVLCHAVLLVQQSPVVFEDAFKQFFLKHDDTMAVKRVKLSILPDLANEDNLVDIVNELAEYVSDINASLARLAIRAVGRIAVKTPVAADRVLSRLLEFLEMGTSSDGVRSEAIVAIKDTLRKYPARARDVLPALPRCLRRAEDTKGKAAAVWMLGEFGEAVEAAPYLLERLVKQAADLDVAVKMELLTALLKLFTKRAPEVQHMLVGLLRHLLADVSDTDLHDRAMFYYRLLRKDVYECARVMSAGASAFAEDDNAALRDKLFDEFNTLSVLFNKPSEQFVESTHLYGRPPAPPPLAPPPSSLQPPAQQSQSAARAPQVVVAEANLLDGDEDIWSLIDDAPPLDQAAFQANWKALPVVLTETKVITRLPSSTADLEAAFAQRGVLVMASGDLGAQMKLFLYALDYDAQYFYAELIIDKTRMAVSCTVKSAASKDSSAKFARVVLGTL